MTDSGNVRPLRGSAGAGFTRAFAESFRRGRERAAVQPVPKPLLGVFVVLLWAGALGLCAAAVAALWAAVSWLAWAAAWPWM